MRSRFITATATAFALAAVLSALPAMAAPDYPSLRYGDTGGNSSAFTAASAPSLVVTNEPAPDVIYRRGSRDVILTTNNSFAEKTATRARPRVETIVSRKVSELSKDQYQLDKAVSTYSQRLEALRADSERASSDYYTLVAVINAQLQSGTTPGNPELVEKWNGAQEKLNIMSESAGLLNGLATDVANEATKASFLLDSTRATFGLSGAVEQDHVELTGLEDDVNQTIVRINRLLNQTNDEIGRRTAFLRSERANMQTLSLAVADGELYGQSISNSLFRKASLADDALVKPAPAPQGSTTPLGRRPLVIVRFDRPGVDFQQAVYTAVGQALDKYPTAKFELIAVSTSNGNAAETALASTAAKKNGEAVLRSLTQMGVPMERISLSAANSAAVDNNEVHIFIQ